VWEKEVEQKISESITNLLNTEVKRLLGIREGV